jgi:hypothetical protein
MGGSRLSDLTAFAARERDLEDPYHDRLMSGRAIDLDEEIGDPNEVNPSRAQLLRIMRQVFFEETGHYPGVWFDALLRELERDYEAQLSSRLTRRIVARACALLEYACSRRKLKQSTFGDIIGTALRRAGVFKTNGGQFTWDDLRKRADYLASRNDKVYLETLEFLEFMKKNPQKYLSELCRDAGGRFTTARAQWWADVHDSYPRRDLATREHIAGLEAAGEQVPEELKEAVTPIRSLRWYGGPYEG